MTSSQRLRIGVLGLWLLAATAAHAATLTGADLRALADFPVQIPTVDGTSLRFGPALSSNFERMMDFPVGGYLVGNTLDYAVKMTRLTSEHDPLIGISDGTTIVANYAGDNDDGTFGINLWSDDGTTSSFHGFGSDTRVSGVGYPPIGGQYEIRTHFEFRADGVYVEGVMNGVRLSHTFPNVLDTSQLKLVIVHDNEISEEYQLDELVLGAADARAGGPVVGWGLGFTPAGAVTAVAASRHHNCAIRAGTGAVVCWGWNGFGQSTVPAAVDGTAGTAIAVAAGGRHSCAIQAGTGAVICWGENPGGDPVPAAVNGVAGTATAIASGDHHACAIQAGSGAIVCWGNHPQAPAPAAVNGTAGSATALSASGDASCAIQAGSGAVVCWGYVDGTVPAAVDGTEGSASAVTAGGHLCAIQAGSGKVVCWGGIRDAVPAAVDGTEGTATAISGNTFHTCAIQAGSGKVICWGRNDDYNGYPNRPVPPAVDGTDGTAIVIAAGTQNCAIQAGSNALVCWAQFDATVPAAIDGTGGTASAIAAGMAHGCAIQAGTGKAVCWGLGYYGQATAPPAIDGTEGTASAIAVGFEHSCAIQAGTGAALCWGRYGQTPPAAVNGTTGTASAIASAGESNNCAIQAGTSAVVCWGGGYYGETMVPAAVDGSAGSAIAIAAGTNHNCAIQAGSGAVICWGSTTNGQPLAPVPASLNGSDGAASAIAAGANHSCAIQSGTSAVVCWGANAFGQTTVPATVDGTEGTASAISAGVDHTCAIQADSHAVVCWGHDDYKQVTVPAAVDGRAGTAIAISAGEHFTLAIQNPAVVNEAPTADAGMDKAIRAGATVALSGTGSYDDNTPAPALGHAWTLISAPAGSAAVLSNATTATPSLRTDMPGDYVVQLVVTDAEGLTGSDSVTISTHNLAPSAIAGADQLVVLGESVTLNGAASVDPEGDALTHRWSIVSAPAGSVAQLAAPDAPGTSFTPDVVGVYEVSLEVSDFLGAGTPDSVLITVARPEDAAQAHIVEISSVIASLTNDQVTTIGNRNALGNFLSQAIAALQGGDLATARRKLEDAIARTDGVVLRGSPDGNGPGRDWITDPAVQVQVHGSLQTALDLITP